MHRSFSSASPVVTWCEMLCLSESDSWRLPGPVLSRPETVVCRPLRETDFLPSDSGSLERSSAAQNVEHDSGFDARNFDEDTFWQRLYLALTIVVSIDHV